MDKPKGLPVQQHTDLRNRQVEYVPPDPKIIREYARAVCSELEAKKPDCADREIVDGLASFLNFIAQTTTKYLNSGHGAYLLNGYKKRGNEERSLK